MVYFLHDIIAVDTYTKKKLCFVNSVRFSIFEKKYKTLDKILYYLDIIDQTVCLVY